MTNDELVNTAIEFIKFSYKLQKSMGLNIPVDAIFKQAYELVRKSGFESKNPQDKLMEMYEDKKGKIL